MAQVLRYFHQDPNKSVQSSSTQLVITQINQSINNNTRALEDKQNTIPGKSLSSNDFTDYYKNKLKGIEEEAEVNVQADWDENDSTADSYIQNKPGIDTVVTEDSNNLITSGAVFNAIDELPEPMIFKGSLGTGGTIQVLPTADNSNVGYTYKVITAGTYDGKTAKPGDTYISDGTEWILIPSGDEPNGTVTNVAMTVPTGLSVSGSPITTSGTLAITYAVGYAIPTLTDQATWTAKQDAISDLSTIRSRADEGHTAYGWGNHANAGYLMAISDLATIRSRADEGHAAYGWGDHSLAGYLTGITSSMVTAALGYTPPQLDTNNYGVDVSLVIKSSTYYPVFYSNTQGTNVGLKSSSSIEYNETDYESALILGDNLFGICGVLGLHNGDGGTTSIISGSGSYGAIVTVPNNSGTLALTSQLNNYLPLSGGTMTGNISFSNSGTGFRGINYGTMGDNDLWRIGGAATGSNAGYMEIATADDGNEPIYVRLYTGVFTTLKRTLTLLDASGNTSMPGSVTAGSFVKSGGTSSLFLKADGSVDSNTYATQTWVSNNYATSNHTHSYLPLSGGTMTGNISFGDSTSTYPIIKFKSSSDPYGQGIYIGGGGMTVIGGGESSNVMAELYSGATEAMAIGNDGDISFFSNLQDGWASRKEMFLTAAGRLVVRHGCIWVQGGSDAGGNSNRLTTTSGMPGDMQYNQNRRGVQIYSNGIAFADPYNGNSNNDSAWIRHLETTANTGLFEIAVGDDAANEEIRFRRYNTSNNIASDVLVPNTSGTLALTSLLSSYLPLSGGTMTGTIVTPADDSKGIEPATNNYGQVGSSSKYFYRSYINNMYGTVKGSFNGGNVTGGDASFYNYKCRNSTGFLIDSYGTFYFNSDGGSGDFNIYNNKNNNPVRAFYINSNNNATLAGTLTLNSDIRLKRIIEDCNIDVKSIANAPLFKFRWKNRDDNNNYIGTSALYWKELIPELVQESDDESNTLSLQYGTLGVVNSISIAKEVVSLKEEIKLLQALIAELKLLLNN